MKPADLLHRIPSVTELLESPRLRSLVDRVSHNVVVAGARSFLDELRDQIRNRTENIQVPSVSEIADLIANRILVGERTALRPVINATGILLHTGLGRACLAEVAVAALTDIARNYASLEMDLASGHRSNRVEAVASLLRQRTGAEASLVVNNNAGATILALAALAAGREVLVSRGQLIEIGGSYRLPDVMAASGAILREVGTTNITHARDYEQAIGDSTALLMRVHASNFRIVGFAETPPIAELVTIAHRHGLLCLDDIGSGALLDFTRFGCSGEPNVRASIEAGADLVLFSGDKLLGGPQCGILVGRQELLDRLARHPLARALRVGKLTLSALAATLRLYHDEAQAVREVPLLQLLAAPVENLKNRAERLAPQIAHESVIENAEPVEDVAYLGGGSIPDQALPTWCIAITPASRNAGKFAKELRLGKPAIIPRIQKDRVLLDLRSVFPHQDIDLVSAIAALANKNPEAPESET
ncbi:MAG: L-seryl-tRNA(Sec) selenium transferase [Pirellulales bacterium]|nr:L-seryl-tRNA(Sec) selenium transferase [Pirellulales bacterium]